MTELIHSTETQLSTGEVVVIETMSALDVIVVAGLINDIWDKGKARLGPLWRERQQQLEEGENPFRPEDVLVVLRAAPEEACELLSAVSGLPLQRFTERGERGLAPSDLIRIMAAFFRVNHLSDFTAVFAELGDLAETAKGVAGEIS